MLNRLLPARLGTDFRWLFGGFVAGNLADGVLLAAGPLLVTSITLEPLAVASAVLAQRLPWVLFGVLAGAIIDRVDRRRLMLAADAFRAIVIATLAVVIVTDHLTLAWVYVTMFLLGTAETFVDNASSALIAMTVPFEGLGVANSRVAGSGMVTNQLAGPPLGALLFSVGVAVPFAANVVFYLAAVLLFTRLAGPTVAPRGDGPPPRLRADVMEGLRWLLGHAPVRTLAMLVTVFNITFGAAFSIWVLYAFERLGLGDLGFGLLMSASAVGGIVGSALFGRLEARWSYAAMLRVGLVVETLTHLVMGLTTVPLVAGLVMVLFGVHAVVWGSLSTTIRQRAVPSEMLGRVTSVYMIGGIGALALGSLIGGLLAQRWGVLAPFWFASAGAGLTTALVWRTIEDVAAAGVPDTAA